MNAELFIRPSWNDHQVVADLLAPGGAGIMVGRQRPIISRLVVDAQLAVQRPQFAEAANGAGIPFLIDPVTTLLHGELRADDPWVKHTPFHEAPAIVEAKAFESSAAREGVVRAVVDFQVEHGATAVIPPYPYSPAPDDPWFGVALDWIALTRKYIDGQGIALPLMPVLCGQLQRLGHEKAWGQGLDRYATVAADNGAQSIALCLSPAGDGHDSYHKLFRLFRAAEHLKAVAQRPVFAWRQGVYGPALVATGLDGYETGMGTSEQSNVRANIGSRKPKPPPAEGKKVSKGGSFAGIYLEPLGKSVSSRVAQLLMANVGMRAKLMCTDERCCPQGVISTLDHRREHAVRSRSRELATIAQLPARAWRLNHFAQKAQAAHTVAAQANRLLAEVGEEQRIHAKGFESLHRVTEELRHADSEGQVVA